MKRLAIAVLMLMCSACGQKMIACGTITNIEKDYDWQCETVRIDDIWDWKSCVGHIKGEKVCLCENGKGDRKLYAQKCP
jgi:hypothetical protein